MTLKDDEAAFLEAKAEIKAWEALIKGPKQRLLEHFRKTGKGSFGKVGYSVSTTMVLDTAAVRAELDGRIDDFLVPSRRETLSVLGS